MKISINRAALKQLDAHRHRLTPQQYKTLRGQFLAGEDAAALRGLQKLERRRSRDRSTQ